MRTKQGLFFKVMCLCLAPALVHAEAGFATTYYVRPDGGTAAQCTGQADEPYPGHGGGHACAWNSPMEALPPASSNQPNKPRISGGDTLIIDSGSYMIGYSPAAREAYGSNVCDRDYSYQCIPQPVPSGPDPQHPTVIRGAFCSAPPELWGTQGAKHVLSLDGSSNVTLACLELTDHSACIAFYKPDPRFACNRKWGGDVGTWASTGLHAQDSGNVTLQDLNIHGFANDGVNAGRIHDWTVQRVTIRANGWSGWDGDLGGNDHSSSNSGWLKFDHLHVEWNGCTEAYPATTITNCWGQNEGGYGDGFAEAWTGGNWVFTNSQFLHNTQDGLDLLYANGTGSILMDHVYAAFNAGNQIKTSGPATLQNSIINGYCNDWQPQWPIAGDGKTGVSGTMCRADGVAVVMMVTAPSQTVAINYSTITGNGDALINGGGNTPGCSHMRGCTGDFVPVASDVWAYSNNIFLGQPSVIPRGIGRNTALDWYSDGTYNGTVRYTNNVIWAVKNQFCPDGNICKDPLLVNETLSAFDATLQKRSPAIGKASSKVSVSTDYHGNPRPPAASIGAVEPAHAPAQ